jgi:hypothetical protein
VRDSALEVLQVVTAIAEISKNWADYN